MLKYDGVYTSRDKFYRYLRFYEDGTVITKNYDSEASWYTLTHDFRKDAWLIFKGRYKLRTDSIEFRVVRETSEFRDAFECKGTIKGDKLELDVCYSLDGSGVHLEYTFRPVPFEPETPTANILLAAANIPTPYKPAEIQAQSLWVFNGDKGTFPSAVFSDFRLAQDWVRENTLSGTLTSYPLYADIAAPTLEAINRALAEIKVVNPRVNIPGPVYLTPESVRRSSPLNSTEHYEFRGLGVAFNPALIASYNHGIFLSGVKFPEVCCVCLKPMDHAVLLEWGVPEGPTVKVDPQGIDQQMVTRLIQACGQKRFWFPVPFCKAHGIYSDGIHIEGVFAFSNREYAQLFARLNGVKGVWVSRTTLRFRKVLRLFGQGLCLIGLLIGAARYLEGDNSFPSWVAPILFIAAFVIYLLSMEARLGRSETIDP